MTNQFFSAMSSTGGAGGGGSGGSGSSGSGGGASSSSGNTPTQPTGQVGGSPTGRRTTIPNNANQETQRGLLRENESANILANKGYNVEQNPPTMPSGKNPDYKIECEYFDNYAPSSQAPVRNIGSKIQDKVVKGQADRIVVNLNDSPVTPEALRQQLTQYPIPDLKEVIAVKTGQIFQIIP